MNADRLLANFSHIADAPDAVPRLRKFILDLAVRGKLVEQNVEEEPAAALIHRINLERAEVANTPTSQKSTPLQPTERDELLVKLPAGWHWVRLGDIGDTNIGLTYSPQHVTTTGTPVLRSTNIQEGKLDLTDLVRVTTKIRPAQFVNEGDLLICAQMGVGV